MASIVLASDASGRPFSIVLVLLTLFLLTSSCGYRFTPVGGIVPESARSISILTFANGTNEPYVDLEVTRAVVEEFRADGRLKVVSSEAADLLLTGTITKFDIIPAAYTTTQYVSYYTVNIGINVSVEDVRTHTLIYEEKGIGSVFSTGYGVTLGDITTTKTAKEAALQSASKNVASTLRSRILDGFSANFK